MKSTSSQAMKTEMTTQIKALILPLALMLQLIAVKPHVELSKEN